MELLVGYTGFVGSNICLKKKFDAVFNSKNIQEAYGMKPDLLIYAGLRAEKYLANSVPDEDMELIFQAEENIKNINPGKLVLISTIDVFKNPQKVDEDSSVDVDGLQAYGRHRYQLELWVKENCQNSLIIRLPGLFGKNIKKNFIYDFINRIPSTLHENKMAELLVYDPDLCQYYHLQTNGFYKIKEIDSRTKQILKRKFRQLEFSALNFTDSRSRYQFYDLSRIWNDIETALNADLRLWHPATEPVSAAELYKYLTGNEFFNELPGIPANYDYRTLHAELYGGSNGYICTKANVLDAVQKFVAGEIK